MSKFKIGDKVKLLDDSLGFAGIVTSGKLYTISNIRTEVQDSGIFLKYYLYFKETDGVLGFIETEFELFNQINTKLGSLF